MIIFGGVGLGEKISWQCGGNKSKELRTRGGGCEESRGMHAFLKGVLSVPSASRRVGGLAGLCTYQRFLQMTKQGK